MKTLIKRLIKGCAHICGAEIVTFNTAQYWERQSLPGVLAQIGRMGVEVNSVIDVGAAHGDWSVTCSTVLPNAKFLLLEPLIEYQQQLENSVQRIPHAEYHVVGVNREPGTRCIRVHPDLVGSSFYLEAEDSDVNGHPRSVPVDTLDSICGTHNLKPPYLIKIDVQGAELDVLAGGGGVLGNSEFVIIEYSYFNFYDNETTIIDVIESMNESGFALYDIFGLSYRPLDGALAQSDLCFVRTDGPFRERHFFATEEQRRTLNRRLQHMNATIAQ